MRNGIADRFKFFRKSAGIIKLLAAQRFRTSPELMESELIQREGSLILRAGLPPTGRDSLGHIPDRWKRSRANRRKPA